MILATASLKGAGVDLLLYKMSHIIGKCGFRDFRPGNIQTSLLS